MTGARAEPPPLERFDLGPPLVIRALAIGAIADVIGALLVVLWAAQGWSVVVLLLGLLLLLSGAALTGAAVYGHRRARQTVVLGGREIVVLGRGAERRVLLGDVTEVKVSDEGLRLLLAEGRGEPVEVVNPQGRGEETFVAMMRAVQVALEAEHGYRALD